MHFIKFSQYKDNAYVKVLQAIHRIRHCDIYRNTYAIFTVNNPKHSPLVDVSVIVCEDRKPVPGQLCLVMVPTVTTFDPDEHHELKSFRVIDAC